METAKNVLPTFYIPHGGGPCFFMEGMGPPGTWDGMAAWLRSLPAAAGAKPKALLIVSAHWEEDQVTLNSGASPSLLYDYYGFPPHTYELKYPAPGAPELARRVSELLTAQGIENRMDPLRGFDHGVFIPFKLIYPDADIPILQMSLKAGLDPQYHLRFGAALEPLRAEGVLIVGSGMSYHNLRAFGGDIGAEHASAFDKWLEQSIANKDAEERNRNLVGWAKAPSARFAHPREEHLLPLMVAAGAAGQDVAARTYSEKVLGLDISGFQFG